MPTPDTEFAPTPIEAYAEAVHRLMPIAMADTSGSRAAAQVLLSAYNGYEFHLDVTDLALLDPRHLACALTVIKGRATLNREPHRVIPGGDEQFLRLWEQWEHLHVDRRYGERS